MNLYEINSGIMECFDSETGEILDPERFESLQMAREEKLENIALWIKNLTADIEALKAEKKAFTERQSKAERLRDRLRKLLHDELQGAGFDTSKVVVSFRKSERVEIAQGCNLPSDLLRWSDPEPNKEEIKRRLKEGCTIDGCTLVECQNIQIK